MDNELYHYGIKGMKWAESKRKKHKKVKTRGYKNKSKIQKEIEIGKRVVKIVTPKIINMVANPYSHHKAAYEAQRNYINMGKDMLNKIRTKM